MLVEEDVLWFDIPVCVPTGVNEINDIYELSKIVFCEIFSEQWRTERNIIEKFSISAQFHD